MRIDFHTHTAASDGALSPAELIDRAREAGIAALAITDHDTFSGFQAAQAKASEAGVSLVTGVELSCVWSGLAVHIVGLGFDPQHPSITQGVARLAHAREERGKSIAKRLAKAGFPGSLDGALAIAGESQLGRPHFAQWMVEQGHISDVSGAFNTYLGQGKIGDVKAFWPELEEVVQWIVASGGHAVIAHPLKYRLTRSKLRRLAADFVAAGGSVVEIVSGRQTQDQIAQLQRLAADFSLDVSVGSDFHRDAPYGPQLGVELPPLRAGLHGVWERLLA